MAPSHLPTDPSTRAPGWGGGSDTPHSHSAADMKCDSWTMAVNTNESQTSRRRGQPTPHFSYWRWASDTNSRLLTSFLLCCLRVRGGDVTFSLCKNTTHMQTFNSPLHLVRLTSEQLSKKKAALTPYKQIMIHSPIDLLLMQILFAKDFFLTRFNNKVLLKYWTGVYSHLE